MLSSGHGTAIALMTSQQPLLPAQDPAYHNSITDQEGTHVVTPHLAKLTDIGGIGGKGSHLHLCTIGELTGFLERVQNHSHTDSPG